MVGWVAGLDVQPKISGRFRPQVAISYLSKLAASGSSAIVLL